MAKKSSIEKNKNRTKLVNRFAAKRAALKAIADDTSKTIEERFEARIKLAALPRNSAKIRLKSRCEVSGRSKAVYRKVKMSRIALRELGNKGLIPGLVKSSW